MLHLIPARFEAMSVEVRDTVGKQLIDLLVLALKADERTLTTGTSTVREAHLTRIESVARRKLGDAKLDPETIARACGISTRYLHELFRDTNQTVGSWIRDQRLEGAREALTDRSNKQSLAGSGRTGLHLPAWRRKTSAQSANGFLKRGRPASRKIAKAMTKFIPSI